MLHNVCVFVCMCVYIYVEERSEGRGGRRSGVRAGVGEGLINKVQACLCLLEAGNGGIKWEGKALRG